MLNRINWRNFAQDSAGFRIFLSTEFLKLPQISAKLRSGRANYHLDFLKNAQITKLILDEAPNVIWACGRGDDFRLQQYFLIIVY